MPAPPAVIDTHVHFWDLARFRYPWLDAEECAPFRSSYLPRQLIADFDDVNVTGLVHVQADIDRQIDPVEETKWLESTVAAQDDLPPTVCVGYADLRAPDLDDVLRRHLECELMRGIRQEAWFDPDSTLPGILRTNLLSDAAWIRGLRSLGRYNLSFELLVKAEQLEQAAAVFNDLPELPVVLEHTGVPINDDGGPPPLWRSGMRAFAKSVPHSVLKISAMGFIRPSWSLADIGPIVREGIEIFGPQRCMLGSNFPVEQPHGSYSRLWRAYDEITSDLSADERSDIFWRTAQRIYQIESA